MDLQALIPTDKHDLTAARRAAEVGYPAIAPILDDLLLWMRDPNWPVAKPIQEVLVKVGAPLAPHVLKILQGDDAIWKLAVLTGIAFEFEKTARAVILEECLRIDNHPTEGELAEGVKLAARDILLCEKWCD